MESRVGVISGRFLLSVTPAALAGVRTASNVGAGLARPYKHAFPSQMQGQVSCCRLDFAYGKMYNYCGNFWCIMDKK